jgi:hypothetical protein
LRFETWELCPKLELGHHGEITALGQIVFNLSLLHLGGRSLTLVGRYIDITSDSFAVVGALETPFAGRLGTAPFAPRGESIVIGVEDILFMA